MNRTLLGMTVLAVTAAVVFTGCGNPDPTKGYTTISQYRPDIKTIAVPIFRRGTYEYRRDIEFRLTEALVKQIEAQTPYKVVSKGNADTELTGTIQSIDQQVLNFDPGTGRAREIQLRVTVDFTWKDLRGEGKVLVNRKNFRVAAEYIPPRPFNEDFFLGSEDAFNKMARRLVEQLAQPW